MPEGGKGAYMALQESGEMYLETILVLSRKSSYVRAIDVGEYMGYSKPSVSRAMGLLKTGGYITVDDLGGIRLTDTGREVAERISRKELKPIINIDSILEFRQITPKFFRLLKLFQPFGPGNLSPVFITENVYDNGNGRVVGSENGHLKLELIQEDEPYRHISAIAFNKSEHFDHIQAGNPIDICYSIAENYYRGIANIQLRIKDIRNREEII